MSTQLNRALLFLAILLLGPAIFMGLGLAVFFALVWLGAKLMEFQHWGLVIAAAAYIALGGMLVWAYRELRKPTA